MAEMFFLVPDWETCIAPEVIGSTKVRFLTEAERAGTDAVAEITMTLPDLQVHYAITGITPSKGAPDV